MIEQQGIVVETDGHMAAVASHGAGSCGGCKANEGCGTASLARFFQRRERILWVQNPVAAQTGDQVIVGMEESALLRSAWLAYAVPVIGLLLGAIAGDRLAGTGLEEPMALVFGLTGLIIGLLVSRILSGRNAAERHYQASVIRILASQISVSAMSAAAFKPRRNRFTERV
jgi:sigma-E factor negative regulatory protein RseC